MDGISSPGRALVRQYLLALSVIGGLLVALALGFVAFARANTLVVTNTNDSGPGSLRQAILDAMPGDTITFANDVSGTITLTSGELVINKRLSIFGPGAAILAVSGNNVSRVFNITDTVAISGLTIRDGHPTGFVMGGGVLMNSGTLTVASSAFVSNTAKVSGGAIRQSAGTMFITGSTFISNSTDFNGGAIDSSSLTGILLHVAASTFVSNTAGNLSTGGAIRTAMPTIIRESTFTGNSAGVGGAIYSGVALTMTNVTVSGNTASNKGGGIAAFFGMNYLNNVTITGNHAGSTYDNNGGGLIVSGQTTLLNTSVLSNTAYSGGGIYTDIAAGTRLTATNVTIGGNSAADSGGGVYNAYDGSTLRNVTVYGNSASTGGGIYALREMTATNTIVAGSLSGGDCYNFLTNRIISLGHNLSSDTSCVTFTASGDITNANPLLGTLAGSPPYYPLLPGSPAIDTGDNNGCPATDQRGNFRPVGGICDIGAYEYGEPFRLYLPLVLK